jgi:HAD superfamily hydrolase (TIGR01509 family)
MQGRNWREFLPEILKESGVDADAESIAMRKTEIYRTSLLTIEINQALVSLLKHSKSNGLKIGLVTSASSASVQRILHAHGLRSLFEVIITGDDVRHHKPHPEPYARAAEDLGVPPESCLVFEDSEVGIISASQAGAQVVQLVF